MVTIGSGAEREVEDYHLSCYACYLIAMNGDSRKQAVALTQTYFALTSSPGFSRGRMSKRQCDASAR